jgi:hypothetical protein
MKKLLLALATVLTASAAHAGFMIEPYVSFAVSGEYKNGSTKEDVSHTGFGARLGYGMLGFSFGLDYGTGSGEIDSSPSVDFDTTDLGLFVAYEFPILVRAYATYILDAKTEFPGGGEYSGGGTKIGIGYTGLPFVVIGVEMYAVNYDTDEGNSSNNVDVDVTATNLVVSIPLP